MVEISDLSLALAGVSVIVAAFYCIYNIRYSMTKPKRTFRIEDLLLTIAIILLLFTH